MCVYMLYHICQEIVYKQMLSTCYYPTDKSLYQHTDSLQ